VCKAWLLLNNENIEKNQIKNEQPMEASVKAIENRRRFFWFMQKVTKECCSIEGEREGEEKEVWG
jgi:hypothetical protein